MDYFTNGKNNKKATNDNSLEQSILSLLESISKSLDSLNIETVNITEDMTEEDKNQIVQDIKKSNESISNAKNAIIRIVTAKIDKKEIDKRKWEGFLAVLNEINLVDTKNLRNINLKNISNKVENAMNYLKNNIINENSKSNKEKVA